MKKSLVLLTLFLWMAGLATNVAAEPPDSPGSPLTKNQLEKVRERIETLRLWKLTKALDLDEKTSALVFPLLNRYDKRRTEVERTLAGDMRDLRKALREKHEERLQGILDDLEQNHKALQGINDEERTALKKILGVEQQAKYVLFQQEFNQEMRKIIAEARERRLGPPEKERFDKSMPKGNP